MFVVLQGGALLLLPDAQTMTVASVGIAVEFGAMFLVFVFRNSLLQVVRPQVLAASPVG